MARKLTTEEIERLKNEHIRILNEIDRQDQARKDTAASYREIIKDLRGNESEVRHMLETGYAVPEQLSLIPPNDPDDQFKQVNASELVDDPRTDAYRKHMADNIHKLK